MTCILYQLNKVNNVTFGKYLSNNNKGKESRMCPIHKHR